MYGGLNSGLPRGDGDPAKDVNYIGVGQASGQAFGKASSKAWARRPCSSRYPVLPRCMEGRQLTLYRSHEK